MRIVLFVLLAILTFHGFAQSGPAGVGVNDGTGSLSIWYDANQGVTVTGTAVTQWDDQSGYNNDATPPAVY